MVRFHLRLTAPLLASACSLACGEGSPSSQPPLLRVPVAIEIVAGNSQTATASTAVPNGALVRVLDADGEPVPGEAVTFSVSQGGGWVVATSTTTDAAGRAAATWYLGPTAGTAQRLQATVELLTTTFEAAAVAPVPGVRTFGADSFIEWIPGTLPLVISAPHGGTITPTTIPDRTSGTTTRDLNTEELARAIVDEFESRFGVRPHLVLSRLSRRKLDANREIVEAAAGNAAAERAWREYHGFLEASVAESRRVAGGGFYVDIHGHGHDIQRLELGYLLSAATLSLPDSQLNADVSRQSSSIWPLAIATGQPFAVVLRGSQSLGSLFEIAGYPSVPSASTPGPGSAPYFDGGYSTARHGRSGDARFAGVQVEINYDGVRDTEANRNRFAEAFVDVLADFLAAHGAALPGAVRREGPRP